MSAYTRYVHQEAVGFGILNQGSQRVTVVRGSYACTTGEGRRMKTGDVAEVATESIGTLSNPVV
jgi:hypothetical protein